MTGKNVKDRTGPGRMDTAHIREIMGEAPVCPRDGCGTSSNDIIYSARKSGSIQLPVYGEEYLHGIAGVQRQSLYIPAVLYRKLFILAGASRNRKVMPEGSINHLILQHPEGYREMVDTILEKSLLGQSQRPVPHDRESPPVGTPSFVSETIAFNI